MTVEAKICGIKTREALDAAIDGGARYVGLVFFAKSPRNLDIETAASLAERARGKARIVALVVDGDDDTLARIVHRVAPDILQLHGDETPDRVREIKARFGLPIIKAVSVATADDAAAAERYAGVADLVLFDAKAVDGAAPGGNGLAFDWDILAAAAPGFVLSGGLTPETVAEAIRKTSPFAVDVSSGVESAPGRKDAEMIAAFMRAARLVSPALARAS